MDETTILFYLSCLFDLFGITIFCIVIKFLRDFKKYKKEIENNFDNRLGVNINEGLNINLDTQELKLTVDNLKTDFDKLNKAFMSGSTVMGMTISGIRNKVVEALDSLKQGMEMLRDRIEIIEEKQRSLDGYKEKVKNKVRKEINIGLRELKNKGKLEN